MALSVKVAKISDLAPGQARVVDAGGTAVALYNVGGTVFATANTCAHRGGPLGEGTLQEGIVTCPWHGFQFSVADGRCKTNPALAVACYPVRLEGDDVLVEI